MGQFGGGWHLCWHQSQMGTPSVPIPAGKCSLRAGCAASLRGRATSRGCSRCPQVPWPHLTSLLVGGSGGALFLMVAAWMVPLASVAITWPWALSSSWGVTACTCRFGAGTGLAAAMPGGFTTHGRVPITCAREESGGCGGTSFQRPSQSRSTTFVGGTLGTPPPHPWRYLALGVGQDLPRDALHAGDGVGDHGGGCQGAEELRLPPQGGGADLRRTKRQGLGTGARGCSSSPPARPPLVPGSLRPPLWQGGPRLAAVMGSGRSESFTARVFFLSHSEGCPCGHRRGISVRQG